MFVVRIENKIRIVNINTACWLHLKYMYMRVYKSKPIFFFQRGRRALGALVLGPPLDIWLRKQIYFNCKRNSKNNDLHSADENEFKYENVPLSNKLKKNETPPKESNFRNIRRLWSSKCVTTISKSAGKEVVRWSIMEPWTEFMGNLKRFPLMDCSRLNTLNDFKHFLTNKP